MSILFIFYFIYLFIYFFCNENILYFYMNSHYKNVVLHLPNEVLEYFFFFALFSWGTFLMCDTPLTLISLAS